jgi:hypothetical protein
LGSPLAPNRNGGLISPVPAIGRDRHLSDLRHSCPSDRPSPCKGGRIGAHVSRIIQVGLAPDLGASGSASPRGPNRSSNSTFPSGRFATGKVNSKSVSTLTRAPGLLLLQNLGDHLARKIR